MTYLPGQIADIGLAISWDAAKYVVEPSTGQSKWLDRVAGTTKGVWDECVDDGGFDPPHFAPPPPVVVPPAVPGDTPQPQVFQLSKAIPLVTMATDANTGKTVGPGAISTSYISTNRPVTYLITQYSHDHNEGLGVRQADVEAALVVPPPPVTPPVVVPPVTPPVTPPVVPPVTPPVDPTQQNAIMALLRAIFDLLKKFFGG